jgi:hypothetical protein
MDNQHMLKLILTAKFNKQLTKINLTLKLVV